jgi:hypothetical protein
MQGKEQQLRVLADEDGRMAFGEVAPDDLVGPLPVSGNEFDPIGVAEIIVSARSSHKKIPGLVIDGAHLLFSQFRSRAAPGIDATRSTIP